MAVSACPQPRTIAVIAHRGEHLHHVENTLEAFRAAIGLGADYFETDVRTSSDGRLVLMHDSTVDRTTRGQGKIAAMTFDQLRALGVPAFEEAAELARGRCGIYVDVKQASPADIVRVLENNGMLDRVVVYAGEAWLKQLQALRTGVRVMPESVSAEVARRLLAELKPKVIAFSARDWLEDIIRVVREAGVGIYVDMLGADDNPRMWQDAIDRGAAGIQTDHPGELVQYLRSRGLHR